MAKAAQMPGFDQGAQMLEPDIGIVIVRTMWVDHQIRQVSQGGVSPKNFQGVIVAVINLQNAKRFETLQTEQFGCVYLVRQQVEFLDARHPGDQVSGGLAVGMAARTAPAGVFISFPKLEGPQIREERGAAQW